MTDRDSSTAPLASESWEARVQERMRQFAEAVHDRADALRMVRDDLVTLYDAENRDCLSAETMAVIRICAEASFIASQGTPD